MVGSHLAETKKQETYPYSKISEKEKSSTNSERGFQRMAEKFPLQVSDSDDDKLSLSDSGKGVDVQKWVADSDKDTEVPLSRLCSEDDECGLQKALRDHAVAKLPATIGQLRLTEWDIVRLLNKEPKLSKKSYAYLADEFNFTAGEVEWLSKVTDPVGEILSKREDQATSNLIDALLTTGNTEIVSQLIFERDKEDFFNFMSPESLKFEVKARSESLPEKPNPRETLSSCKQNSLDGRNSLPSENQDPLAESWNSSISSLNGGFVYQGIPAEEYHSEESKIFWDGIEGSVEEKSIGAFERSLEKLFHNDPSFARERMSRVMKFIATVLEVSLANPEAVFIRRLEFVHLVACFGPAVVGKGGCFEKIFDLMKKSLVSVTRKRRKEKESWFAGKMSTMESYDHFKRFTSNVGDFLIRFSESKAKDGYFVLAFQTKDEGPVEIQIENDPKTQILTLGKRQFKSLPDLVAKCRMDAFSEHKVVLAHPCPELRMTGVCKGYFSIKKPKV